MNTSQKNTFLPINSELSKITLQWLKWQCRLMSDVQLGVVYLAQSTNGVEKVAQWPEQVKAIPSRLEELSLDMLSGADSFVCKEQCLIDDKTSVCEVFSVAIKNRSSVIGSVSLMLTVRSEEQKKAVLQLLQWGCIWLESLLSNALEEVYQADAILSEAAGIILLDDPEALTANKLCNAIQKRFHCQRVAFGRIKGLQVRLTGLSEQLKFNKNSEVSRLIELAMEESAEQDSLTQYPPVSESSVVLYHHKELVETAKGKNVVSIPLKSKQGVLGVLLLLRESSFNAHEIKTLEYLARLTSIGFLKSGSKDKYLPINTRDSKFNFLNSLIVSGYLKLKLMLLLLIISGVVLSFIETEQKVYAKSDVVGSVQYQIVAPQDGYIDSAEVRAGDNVEKDDVIFTLDSKDLLLEKQRLQSELSKVSRSYQQALAKRERAEVGIALAERSQVQAKLNLINEKLKRAQIRSPIDGLVVSGDLSQKLGAPIEKGQVVFELAPLSGYRVILKVDEHDFARVAIGQSGTLRLAGLPYDPFNVTLTRITAQSEAEEGGNYFRIEADVNATDIAIKPGMQGVTQIVVGKASILWVWAHSTLDRLRLWFWSMGL